MKNTHLIYNDLFDEEAYEALREFYSPMRARMAAIECGYLHAYGELPEWGVVIDTFEVNPDGSYIYVHNRPH